MGINEVVTNECLFLAQLVMQYLYKGGCEDFDIDQNHVLEVGASIQYVHRQGLLMQI